MFMVLAATLLTGSTGMPVVTDSAESRPITLDTPTGKLYGTELLPAGSGRHPVVLIVAGSGPTDRDGNSPVPLPSGKPLHTDAYRLLAEALAANGIASVRYDKRGVAASASAMAGKSEIDLTFETGIQDAVAWLDLLRADRRFSSVVVAGHSEGSLVGMVAAARAKADGFVSLEGAGRRASAVLRSQLAAQGVPLEMYGTTLDTLDAGHTVNGTAPALAMLFRPSVQPYLISWFRYDPAAEIRKLSVATLVIQGTHDVQTSVQDAKLLAAAPGAKLVLVDGMTHVLKDGPADATAQLAVYTDPSTPLDPTVVAAVVAYARAAPQPR
ncbi:MAG: alpha/beta fold hydrolase [Gemmatimonadota bacterium]|nr:alpha/beta fold hydrolase [Gemmatimonadota bacterium]